MKAEWCTLCKTIGNWFELWMDIWKFRFENCVKFGMSKCCVISILMDITIQFISFNNVLDFNLKSTNEQTNKRTNNNKKKMKRRECRYSIFYTSSTDIIAPFDNSYLNWHKMYKVYEINFRKKLQSGYSIWALNKYEKRVQ